MNWVLIILIRLYQRTLSPDHGPLKRFFPYGFCRFHPTCSDYGLHALRRHGFWHGGALMTWRILRCNPLSPGGEDPVPEQKTRA